MKTTNSRLAIIGASGHGKVVADIASLCGYPDLHFYPGVKDLLAELRRKGKKLGVLTDGRPEGQRKKIKSLQLERYVDAIVITDELGGARYRKPCEAGFLEICRRLDVPPSSAVYIGDNLQKDWNGARKAGLDFIWFRNEDGLYV